MKIKQCNRNPCFLADFAYDGEFSDGNRFALRIPERDVVSFASELLNAFVDDKNGKVVVTIPHIKCVDGKPVFVEPKVERKEENVEVEIVSPQQIEIEGWATKDYPGDDVVVHLNEPHRWKFQPEDKDEYWVSRGSKYDFADSLFPNLTPEKPQKVRITITPKDLLDAHEAGAIGALSGQWRKDTDTEGLKDGDQVIVAIQRVDNSQQFGNF